MRAHEDQAQVGRDRDDLAPDNRAFRLQVARGEEQAAGPDAQASAGRARGGARARRLVGRVHVQEVERVAAQVAREAEGQARVVIGLAGGDERG